MKRVAEVLQVSRSQLSERLRGKEAKIGVQQGWRCRFVGAAAHFGGRAAHLRLPADYGADEP